MAEALPQRGTDADPGAADRRYLRRCIRLARKARGATSPNPMVGALVVRDGRVIAEDYHRCPGTPHAEQLVLAIAGELARGATLYTNMEPCCHQGRTPPCVEGIVTAGIERVAACTPDPDSRVDHRGFAALQEAGVRLDVGQLADEAARLNEAYITLKREGRPFIVAKAAVSLDGRMATRKRQSQWISGEVARKRTHRLRAFSDAVVVGAGTAVDDDPRLTARLAQGPGPRYRVVLDSRLRTPADGRLLSEETGQVLIFTTDAAPAAARRVLEAAGAEVVEVEGDALGRADWAGVLDELVARDVMSVLVEGGSELLTSAFEADIIDKLFLIYAPLLIGGSSALSLWGGDGIGDLGAAPRLHHVRRFRLGEDWAVEGYIHSPEPPV